ncbi:LacI family DNA-binding transcriptional regulator [Phenylobacterium hankyongense]|uniref:LacI family DNA-binding transcriptional regulator n=1 Tax=Phenylobacterium hankyongense TaxID=1813876 RepID=UPI003C720C9C
MPTVTIDDVAELAGVSIKTVSRVLNQEPHVREATRERVLKAAKELDYTPNVSARALAGARSYLIGLYYDNPSPGYVGQVEQGAMAACRPAGYHLIVEQVQEAGATLRERIAAFHARVRPEGVLLTPPLCDLPEVLEALDAAKANYVRIAPSRDLERSPYVYIDDRKAAEEMTHYLQGLGHRDIAFIQGPPDHFAAARRCEGFLDAMASAGLAVRPEWVQPGEFSFRSGSEAGERLLSSPDRPTAIFAGNDDMALGVMAVANRLQIEIPSGLSVVGFDDSPSAQVVWPQLTTVRQPTAEMAAVAAEMLIGRRAAARGPRGRLLAFTLVPRQSSGPPPGAA